MKTILLVNPISSANYLNDKLKEFNIYTVAIYTIAVDKLSEYTQINPELFHLADGSFRLIEINPRISGTGGMCNMLAQVSGYGAWL